MPVGLCCRDYIPRDAIHAVKGAELHRKPFHIQKWLNSLCFLRARKQRRSSRHLDSSVSSAVWFANRRVTPSALSVYISLRSASANGTICMCNNTSNKAMCNAQCTMHVGCTLHKAPASHAGLQPISVAPVLRLCHAGSYREQSAGFKAIEERCCDAEPAAK